MQECLIDVSHYWRGEVAEDWQASVDCGLSSVDLPAPLGGRRHRGHDGAPESPELQRPDGGRRAAPRAGHLVLQ